jgi:hypothetical protein
MCRIESRTGRFARENSPASYGHFSLAADGDGDLRWIRWTTPSGRGRADPYQSKRRGTDVEPWGETFDRDLDSHPPRPVSEPLHAIEEDQRLVANPFLAVLSWVAAVGLVRESVKQQNLALLMMAVILFFIAFFFLQFHCLDCGETGWLLRSWAHACPPVIARRRSQAVRRFRGPGLKLQLVAWFIFLTAALVLGAVALGSRR